MPRCRGMRMMRTQRGQEAAATFSAPCLQHVLTKCYLARHTAQEQSLTYLHPLLLLVLLASRTRFSAHQVVRSGCGYDAGSQAVSKLRQLLLTEPCRQTSRTTQPSTKLAQQQSIQQMCPRQASSGVLLLSPCTALPPPPSKRPYTEHSRSVTVCTLIMHSDRAVPAAGAVSS